jgi:hypothetical protein
MRILNVHAGLNKNDIINFVSQANEDLINSFYYKKIILFFDEVNTNSVVSGLMKEIIVDRKFQGDDLSDLIIPIAACNPYKLKNET